LARRKVVLVIVEGKSDKEALELLINRVFSNDTVHVEILKTDITSNFSNTPDKIINAVHDVVLKCLRLFPYRKTDFKEIIHIMDTDGTYIPNNKIIFDELAIKLLYSTTEIRTCNKEMTENRNRQKSNNMNKLCSRENIGGISYSAYYMSCNLDHVLYNKMNSSKDEKTSDSNSFRDEYDGRTSEFVKFISESEFSVVGDYYKSWEFIKQGLHSLERHTNLGICFQGVAIKKQ
jgi:hypothetical protein